MAHAAPTLLHHVGGISVATVLCRCEYRGNADRLNVFDSELLRGHYPRAVIGLDGREDQVEIRVLRTEGLGDENPELELALVSEALAGKVSLTGVVGIGVESLPPLVLVVGPGALDGLGRVCLNEVDVLQGEWGRSSLRHEGWSGQGRSV